MLFFFLLTKYNRGGYDIHVFRKVINNMEMIDILDEKGNKTGEVLSRKEVHKNGYLHGAVVATIINENNEILIQQRSDTKEKYPGKWDLSVAGHISSNEDSLMTILKETTEELGLKVKKEDFEFITTFKRQEKFSGTFIENEIFSFYILKIPHLKLSDINLQVSEVKNIKFVNIDEFKQMIEKSELAPKGEAHKILINYFKRMV